MEPAKCIVCEDGIEPSSRIKSLATAEGKYAVHGACKDALPRAWLANPVEMERLAFWRAHPEAGNGHVVAAEPEEALIQGVPTCALCHGLIDDLAPAVAVHPRCLHARSRRSWLTRQLHAFFAWGLAQCS